MITRRRGGANLSSVIGTVVVIAAFVFYPQVFYGFAGFVWKSTLSQMASIGHHPDAHQLGKLSGQGHGQGQSRSGARARAHARARPTHKAATHTKTVIHTKTVSKHARVKRAPR